MYLGSPARIEGLSGENGNSAGDSECARVGVGLSVGHWPEPSLCQSSSLNPGRSDFRPRKTSIKFAFPACIKGLSGENGNSAGDSDGTSVGVGLSIGLPPKSTFEPEPWDAGF